MELTTKTPCEFRLRRNYTAQNGSVSYFYTFENESVGSFELWAKDPMVLEKGKMYNLVFNMGFFQGNQKVTLKEVIPVGK